MSNLTIELYEIYKNPIFEVFDFEYDFYCDEVGIIENFEKKFIQHYAFYEINQPVVYKWKWQLKSKLDLIMPYYKQLYETELRSKELDFLLNKDYREEFIREVDRGLVENGTETGERRTSTSNKTTSSNTGSSNRKSTNDSTVDGKSSNTDNGNASLDLKYLTGISQDKEKTSSTEDFKTNNTDTENKTGTIEESNSNNSKKNTDEKLTEKNITIGKGNIGVTSSAELLQKWRDVLINIDKMIIEECRDLFLMVY